MIGYSIIYDFNKDINLRDAYILTIEVKTYKKIDN